jgi:hypothetical protein
MGYDDIVKAQTKHDAKEVVGEGNRRSPRRKSSAPLVAGGLEGRLEGHERVKWKLPRMKLKHWGWGITALFCDFDD